MSYYEKIKEIREKNKKLKNLSNETLTEIFKSTFGRNPEKSKNELHSTTGKIKKNVLVEKIERERFKNIYKDITGKEPEPAFNLMKFYDDKAIEKFLNIEMAKRKGKEQIQEVKEIETTEKQLVEYKKKQKERQEKGDVEPSKVLITQEYNRPKKEYKKPVIKTIHDLQEKADQLTFNPALQKFLSTETRLEPMEYLRPNKQEEKRAITYKSIEERQEPKASKFKVSGMSFEKIEQELKRKKEKVKKEIEERPISEFQYEMMKQEANEQERIRQKERDEFFMPPPPPQMPNQNLNVALDEFEQIGEPHYQTDILKEYEKPKPAFSSPKVEKNYFDILKKIKEDKPKEQPQPERRQQYKREIEIQTEEYEPVRLEKEKDKQRKHETKTQLISEGFKLGGEVVKTAGALGKEAISGYFSKETQKLKGEQEKELKQLEADLLRKAKEHEQELKIKFQPYELEREEKLKNINLDRENRLKDIDIEKIKAIGEIDIRKVKAQAKAHAKASTKMAEIENASALNRQIQAQIHQQSIQNLNTPRPYEQLTRLTDSGKTDHTITTKGDGVIQIINRPVYTRAQPQPRRTRLRKTKPKELKTNKIKLSKSRL